MSEPKLISPMLDNFDMGDPISEHNGVRCCPAMEKDSDNKYIVKIISTPTSQTQLDALLLSGAYNSNEAALDYFKVLTDGIADEAQILQKLSQLEGFLPFENWQIELMDDGIGYDIYLLSSYKKTLQKFFQRNPMTHLGALNLGLDLCAALAVCRRSGYLYVNLKPANIYLTAENEYRIGDIGFIKLDSLKYTSLPDRYRSEYTAPEIADAYSALNTTIDVYALGLILYQAFNDGVLPVVNSDNADGQLQPPTYADYEMSEIILKACATNPEDRWQDPIEFGQALVGYMQRNGAHDTPIVPQATIEEDTDSNNADEIGAYEDTGETDLVQDSAEENTDSDAETIEDSEPEVSEEDIYTEDEDGNLTVIVDDENDETLPDETSTDVDYEEVSEEVNEILNQADELIAHDTPDPVVAPEPVEINIPPVAEEEITETESEENESDPEDTENSGESQESENPEESEQDAVQDSADEEETVAEPDDSVDSEDADEEESEEDELDEDDEESAVPQNRRAKKWVWGIVIGVLVAALLAAGYYFYKNYYLQPIESIVLDDSEKGTLTVYVTSQIDESKLTVVCLDTYGNPLTAPVKDGKAVITGLASDSAYKVKVVIDGFHKLTGDTSAAFTTPEETNIVQFQAATGTEDGSVILGFTIEGPDSNQWIVRYSSENEEEKETSFSGHMVTLTGLTVGTEYTFTLLPTENLVIAGTDKLTYTATKVVKADDLYIAGIVDGVLTAKWKVSSDATVESWTVRCYNDSGYDQTVVVNETTASFSGIDATVGYTVEVTANSMSVSERAFAEANSITISNLAADTSNANKTVLSWDSSAEKNWILSYSVDGSAVSELSCETNTATLEAVVPGSEYTITILAADGTPVLGGMLVYSTNEAAKFSGFSVTADNMNFRMCETPSQKNWDRYDLSSSDYKTEFKVGEKASFLVKMKHEYDVSSEKITILYVIRDSEGKVVSTSSKTSKWKSLWSRNYGEFDIHSLPQTPGQYNVCVYFNGQLAKSQDFTIV